MFLFDITFSNCQCAGYMIHFCVIMNLGTWGWTWKNDIAEFQSEILISFP